MNKIFSIIIAIALLTVFAPLNKCMAQEELTDAQIVDSLFLRASSGMVMFRDQEGPSKQALIDMGARAIPQLLTKLDTRSAREMLTLSDIFKGIGESAVAPLSGKLKSHDDYVRRLAIRCLGEIGSPKAIGALAELVDNEDFRTRSGVMHTLGQIGDPAGAPYVMKGLFDSDYSVATSAAVACGKIKTGIDPIALVETLDHPYYGVRYSAMNSLVLIGEPSVGPLLQYVRTHSVDISTGYALEALGKLKTKKALAIYKQTLFWNDWSFRAYTAEALGDLQQKKAKKLIKKALKTETHPLVKSKLMEALAKYK
jgi:HEAT repeat protein